MKTAKALRRIESVEAHLTAIRERYKTDDQALIAALSQLTGNLASVKRALSLLATRELADKPPRIPSPSATPKLPATSTGRIFRGKRRSVAD